MRVAAYRCCMFLTWLAAILLLLLTTVLLGVLRSPVYLHPMVNGNIRSAQVHGLALGLSVQPMLYYWRLIIILHVSVLYPAEQVLPVLVIGHGTAVRVPVASMQM